MMNCVSSVFKESYMKNYNLQLYYLVNLNSCQCFTDWSEAIPALYYVWTGFKDISEPILHVNK